MPITCDAPTPHFSSGCVLLLHYDADNDGIVNVDELNQAYADCENEVITEEEYDFVSGAHINGGINVVCLGCYIKREPGICFTTGEDWAYPLPPLPVFKGQIKLAHTCVVSDVVTKPGPASGGRVTSWVITNKDGEEVSKLEAGIEYNIEVHTASYPQCIHDKSAITNSYGTLKFVSFIDANGKSYTNKMPVLIFEGVGEKKTVTFESVPAGAAVKVD